MSVHKRFDPQLYAENDEKSKNFTRNLLKGSEYQVLDNPKKRGVDLLVYKDSKHICNIEVEIKLLWKTKDFPYENVNIPVRKEKYAKLDKPTIFLMQNKDQTDYLCILDKDLLDSPKKEVPNKYSYAGEFFYQVPLDKVIFNDLLKVLRST